MYIYIYIYVYIIIMPLKTQEQKSPVLFDGEVTHGAMPTPINSLLRVAILEYCETNFSSGVLY